MSDTLAPDHLLETRGASQQTGAFVVACAFSRSGKTAAFALGDGTLRLAGRGEGAWRTIEAHDGGCLALAPDVAGESFLSGGDDGHFLRIGEGITEIASFGLKWVEQAASFAAGKTQLLACSVGKQAILFDAAGQQLKTLVHPSTVTGLAFDAKGKRLAASHYDGASLWFVAAKADKPRRLEWKGSHTAITLSPDGDVVVTAMQENALHGWRLSDGQHMRMSGYPAKIKGLGFTHSGKWLASSGADAIVLWPFTGGGPMGKAPNELAGGGEVLCTTLACHPEHEVVAAGFADGLVVMVDVTSGRVLPVCGPGRGPVSAIAWSGDGSLLAFGTETGFAALVDFSAR
jgi:WD40 repeat protein